MSLDLTQPRLDDSSLRDFAKPLPSSLSPSGRQASQFDPLRKYRTCSIPPQLCHPIPIPLDGIGLTVFSPEMSCFSLNFFFGIAFSLRSGCSGKLLKYRGSCKIIQAYLKFPSLRLPTYLGNQCTTHLGQS